MRERAQHATVPRAHTYRARMKKALLCATACALAYIVGVRRGIDLTLVLIPEPHVEVVDLSNEAIEHAMKVWEFESTEDETPAE